jgi:hypothetical protein
MPKSTTELASVWLRTADVALEAGHDIATLPLEAIAQWEPTSKSKE